MNAAEHRRASPLLSTPPRSLQRMLHANIHYTVTLTRLLAPLIIQRTSRSRTQLRSPQYSTPAIRTVADNTTVDLNIGGGRILFVDSLLSKGPATGNSLYAASKAFMSYFAQVIILYYHRTSFIACIMFYLFLLLINYLIFLFI